MDKYAKMETCKHHTAQEYLQDYCDHNKAWYSCDAPTDCPLWNECEKCSYYEPKDKPSPKRLVSIPCSARELEDALHRVCDHAGLWDAKIVITTDKILYIEIETKGAK